MGFGGFWLPDYITIDGFGYQKSGPGLFRKRVEVRIIGSHYSSVPEVVEKFLNNSIIDMCNANYLNSSALCSKIEK